MDPGIDRHFITYISAQISSFLIFRTQDGGGGGGAGAAAVDTTCKLHVSATLQQTTVTAYFKNMPVLPCVKGKQQ